MATIRVMSAGAVESMVKALGKEFEQASGHTLDLNFNTAGNLRGRLDGGEKTDIVILPAATIEAMEKTGKLAAGSRLDLGRTVTGVCVKEGAAAPDISTPDAFKQALIKARGVSFSDPKAGGSSGTFFASLLDKLGIADEVFKKAVLGKRGYEVAQAVVDGRVDIGTTFISEMLTVPGTKVLGPLPGWMANTNTYTAGILAESQQQEAARALLRALTNPATRQRWIAAGLEPAFP